MTLQQMRYVITTAECYSITSAAEKFQLSQPNLSNAIKDLEQELGIQIIRAEKKRRLFNPRRRRAGPLDPANLKPGAAP